MSKSWFIYVNKCRQFQIQWINQWTLTKSTIFPLFLKLKTCWFWSFQNNSRFIGGEGGVLVVHPDKRLDQTWLKIESTMNIDFYKYKMIGMLKKNVHIRFLCACFWFKKVKYQIFYNCMLDFMKSTQTLITTNPESIKSLF